MLLDTNVVSEFAKPQGRINPGVARWAWDVDRERAHISAITVEEISLGILRRSRRDRVQGGALQRWFSEDVLEAFTGKVLAFDQAAALKAAELQVARPRPVNDTRLAAIALVHGL
ncbi:MAG: PIN domain-containing protein, partial [Bifidobacteriaceae bacterium]|nr:PIN domain-containing protein [Bifidobacteriaceae bacterium]